MTPLGSKATRGEYSFGEYLHPSQTLNPSLYIFVGPGGVLAGLAGVGFRLSRGYVWSAGGGLRGYMQS